MPEMVFAEKQSAELRKGQGDPLVMYLIVRESLGMSPGKVAVQCAHASQMLSLLHSRNEMDDARADGGGLGPARSPEELSASVVFREWIDTSFRKVALRADDKEWERVKSDPSVQFIVVRDAGLTKVEAGSETVVGLWPLRKSEAPKSIRRLQVLR